jgi:hypothetical protein
MPVVDFLAHLRLKFIFKRTRVWATRQGWGG